MCVSESEREHNAALCATETSPEKWMQFGLKASSHANQKRTPKSTEQRHFPNKKQRLFKQDCISPSLGILDTQESVYASTIPGLDDCKGMVMILGKFYFIMNYWWSLLSEIGFPHGQNLQNFSRWFPTGPLLRSSPALLNEYSGQWLLRKNLERLQFPCRMQDSWEQGIKAHLLHKKKLIL